MATIDRNRNRILNTIRSIDRGMSRMTLETGGRIKAMRRRMEGDRQQSRRYDATAQEVEHALTILATRISMASHPRKSSNASRS